MRAFMLCAGRPVEEDDAEDGAALPGRALRHLLRAQHAGVGAEEQRGRALRHPLRAVLPVVRHLHAPGLHRLLLWLQEGRARGPCAHQQDPPPDP